MPHHARCVSSFRLGIRISSGCGKVFPGASLPGRLSLLAGLRPASPGPAVLIRGDDPPDPHDRGWGWFCHWRRDDPPNPRDRGWGWGWGWFATGGGTTPRTPTTGAGVGFATGGGTAPGPPRPGLGLVLPLAAGRPPDPHDRGSGWFCHGRRDDPRTPTTGARVGFATGGGTAPGPPRCRVSVVAPGSGCGRWRLGDVGLPLEICHLRWRPPDSHGAGSLLWHPALAVAGGAWATLACRWRFATCGGTDTPGTPDVRAAPSQATPLRAVSCCFPSSAAGVWH